MTIKLRVVGGVALIAAMAATTQLGCGGGDTGSAPGTAGGAGGAGGSGTGGSGTGGTGTGGASGAGTGGSGAGGSGAGSGTGGSAGVTGTGGSAGSGQCAVQHQGTSAVQVTMQVTWPGTVGTQAGSGTVHVWTRSTLTVSDTPNAQGIYDVTGENIPCGSVIPDIQETAVAGGKKVAADFPDAVWDSPSMPKFNVTGVTEGFQPGDKIHINPVAVLVGASMTDPSATWPAVNAVQSVDHDGDGHPGITSVPRVAPGYGQPPVSLAASFTGPYADLLYIASRTTTELLGSIQDCDTVAGDAIVSHFDNHVIGCHISSGDCNATQSNFIDSNRTVYTVKSATYKAVRVKDNATCTEVRAANPM